jgi:hypothetical protein
MITRNLTKGYDEAQHLQHASTVPGMAHFALTGPEGTTCRECASWACAKKYHRHEGWLKARRCVEFTRLMRMVGSETVHGPAVDPQTPSCSHFNAAGAVPALITKRRASGCAGKAAGGKCG